MPVPTRITDISTTAASNSPSGAESVGTSLDDYLRAVQTVYRLDLASKGSDIASASTTDLGAVGGYYHDITGTTTITSFGTVAAGIPKVIKFEGALTLTHNATSLILPGGANIITADGDIAIVVSEGSGNWRCVSYFRAASEPLAFATQAQQETGASNVVAVTPGRQHNHPSAAKGWVMANFDGTTDASYNVTSVTDSGTGVIDITWATDFSSAAYCAVACAKLDTSGGAAGTAFAVIGDTGFAAGTTRFASVRMSDFASVDVTDAMVVVFGDQ